MADAQAGTVPVLEVADLGVAIGTTRVIQNISFSVSSGTIVVVSGVNGCGKTTLLRAIAEVIRPSRGGVRVRCPPRNRRRGGNCTFYLPQGAPVFKSLRVRDMVSLLSGIARGQHSRILWALAQFPSLRGRSDVLAGRLSGGERQQLYLASALLSHASLFVLDEPLAGVSEQSIAPVLSALQAIVSDGSRAIVMAEHNTHAMTSLPHRHFVLQAGQLQVAPKQTPLRTEA